MTTRVAAPPDAAALLAEYRKAGVLLLKNFFNAEEAAVWDAECNRLLAPGVVAANDPRVARRQVGGAPVVERFDPVMDVSPVFTRLANDPRLLAIVETLLGEQANVFKDKLIFKRPGMSGYDMHQDWAWWQFAKPDSMLSVQVAVDGAEGANGALELFPGYHQSLLSPPGELRNLNDEEVRRVDLAKGVLLSSQPGDVAIFHALTPHRSGPNQSSHSRRSFYLTYAAASNGDMRSEYYQRRRDRLGRGGLAERAVRFLKRMLG